MSLGRVLVFATLLGLAAQARAGGVVIASPGVLRANAAGGTTDFQATSYVVPPAVPPALNRVVAGAGPGMPAVPGALAPPFDVIPVPRCWVCGVTFYGPTVGVLAVNKPLAAPAVQSVTSTTAAGTSLAIALSSYTAGPPGVVAASSATAGPGATYAVAATVDPVALAGDAAGYGYDATIASMSLGPDAGEHGFASLFAFDDRASTPLFSLTLIAFGPVASTSDVLVQFSHDDSRLTLDRTPAAVIDGVRGAFTITNGVATLPTDFQLFSGQYLAPTPVSFSFGVRSGLGTVPEPASWAMLVTGFGLCGAGLRRRRQLATA